MGRFRKDNDVRIKGAEAQKKQTSIIPPTEFTYGKPLRYRKIDLNLSDHQPQLRELCLMNMEKLLKQISHLTTKIKLEW
jgi:hypothetical protein